MSQQQFQPRPSQQRRPESEEAALPVSRVAAGRDAYDAVLDEIDALLDRDAEAYVRGFVQKGGQ